MKLPTPPAPPAPPALLGELPVPPIVVKLPAPPAPPALLGELPVPPIVVKLPAPPAPPAAMGDLPVPMVELPAPPAPPAELPVPPIAVRLPTPPAPSAPPVTQVVTVPAAKQVADALVTAGVSKPAAPGPPVAVVSAATGTDALGAALNTPPAPPAPPTASSPLATSAGAPIGVAALHHSAGVPPSWILPAGFAQSVPNVASPLPVTVTRSTKDGASVPASSVPPVVPGAPFGVGVAGAGGASGVGTGLMAVLLLALGWLALQRFFRLVLAPAVCRPVAFCWLLERPG